jgi:predicted RNA-binding protein with TRAM domain
LLRASLGEWAEPAEFTYEWKSISTTNVTTTVGTGDTYTVAAADLGKKITLTVTARLTGYVTTSKVSALTATVVTGTFAAAPVPTISGTATFGQTLTAVTGTWSNSPAFTFQWRRSGSTTVIGTAARYTLGAADIGKTLTVTVTATKTGFLTTSKSSVATATVASATFATAPTPTITGAAVFGETLRAVTGTWSNAPGLTYQWKRSGSTTVLGTLATYTLTAAEIGTTVTVTVTATKSGFTTLSKTSAATPAVVAATFSTAPTPTISGTATFGQTLRAVTGDWSNTPGFTYEWTRSGSTTVIGTAATYTLAVADLGKTITVTVIGTKAGFTTLRKTSAATLAVASATFATAPNPTISGTATVGQPLTAATTGWVPSDGVNFIYVWKRADTSGGVGTVIAGAITNRYILALADKGKYISVTVTADKAGYTSVSTTGVLATPIP